MTDKYKERKRKAEVIINMYGSKCYRQEDIAEELGISILAVRKVTKMYGYEHTKKKSNSNPNNLNKGQVIKPLIHLDELSCLDKYDIWSAMIEL